MAGVDAFGLLKEELKSEDIQDQVNAARRVNTIALGMGEDRARGELIPFLRQRVDEYTDEILLVSVRECRLQCVGLEGAWHSLCPYDISAVLR